MADRRDNAVATAQSYHQGNIAGLDDAMTRRLIASTVMTESNGGDLTITNRQGYTGRYQAGAGWLADAGYVDQDKLHEAMKGYRRIRLRSAPRLKEISKTCCGVRKSKRFRARWLIRSKHSNRTFWAGTAADSTAKRIRRTGLLCQYA